MEISLHLARIFWRGWILLCLSVGYVGGFKTGGGGMVVGDFQRESFFYLPSTISGLYISRSKGGLVARYLTLPT